MPKSVQTSSHQLPHPSRTTRYGFLSIDHLPVFPHLSWLLYSLDSSQTQIWVSAPIISLRWILMQFLKDMICSQFILHNLVQLVQISLVLVRLVCSNSVKKPTWFSQSQASFGLVLLIDISIFLFWSRSIHWSLIRFSDSFRGSLFYFQVGHSWVAGFYFQLKDCGFCF